MTGRMSLLREAGIWLFSALVALAFGVAMKILTDTVKAAVAVTAVLLLVAIVVFTRKYGRGAGRLMRVSPRRDR